MDSDYQQKYNHLQSVCKKQQKTIVRLQLQIRQRCQSYLLHSSRHKLTPSNDQRIHADSVHSSSSKNKISNLEDSVVETVQWTTKVQDEPYLMKSGLSCQSVITKRTTQNFSISSQINITQTPDLQKQLQKAEQKVNYQQMINSFKDRIVRIQQQKNKNVKEMHRLQEQLAASIKKASDLQKKIEISEKEFRKIKSKLQQANQIQTVTIQIYQQLREKLNIKAINGPIQDFNNSKIKQKLNVILQLTQQQFQCQIKQKSIIQVKNVELFYEKVHDIMYEPIVQKQKETQHQIPKAAVKQEKMIQTQTEKKQQESQYQLSGLQPQINKVIEILIEPTSNIQQTRVQQSIQKLALQHKEQILKILQQKQIQITVIKNQLKSLHQKHIQNANYQHQTELELLRQQLEKQKQKLQIIKQQEDRLEEQNLTLITDNMQKQNKISNLSLQIQRMKRQTEQLSIQQSKLKQEIEDLKIIESNFESTKNQLDKSRSIIDDLESSKIVKQLKQMKQTLSKSRKAEGNDSLSNSGFNIVQKLEEPYYVQEQLQNDMNHEYVKRSFIRKKIVRRNLSATAYRVISRSKQQVNDIIKSKISQYSDKSLQKSKKIQSSPKKTQLKSNLKDQRISELSEQNRDSDYFNNIEQVVKVIEVTTKTPREQITTTKISSKNFDQSKSFRKRHQP